MKKLNYILSKFEDITCSLGLLGATILMFVNVIMRYLFSSGLPWSEELVRYTIIWVTFIGIAMCARKGMHVAIDLFLSLVNKKIEYILLIIINITSIFFCTLMTLYSIRLVWQISGSSQLSPSLEIPFYIIYLCMPIGFSLSVLRFTQNTLNIIKRNKQEI